MQQERAYGGQRFRAKWLSGVAALLGTLAAVTPARAQEPEAGTVFNQPTYSSPIAISADDRLVWSVNPGDDSVSVLRTDTNTVLKKIPVGDEPQSVALDPNNSSPSSRTRPAAALP
jgi:YVTN family beta-propeller protein